MAHEPSHPALPAAASKSDAPTVHRPFLSTPHVLGSRAILGVALCLGQLCVSPALPGAEGPLIVWPRGGHPQPAPSIPACVPFSSERCISRVVTASASAIVLSCHRLGNCSQPASPDLFQLVGPSLHFCHITCLHAGSLLSLLD